MLCTAPTDLPTSQDKCLFDERGFARI